MGKSQNIDNLRKRIEKISSELVMLDPNVQDSLKEFLNNLQSFCLAEQKGKLNMLNNIYNLIVSHIEECRENKNSDKTKNIYEILSFGISVLKKYLDYENSHFKELWNIEAIEGLCRGIAGSPGQKNYPQYDNEQLKDIKCFISEALNAITEIEKIVLELDSNQGSENKTAIYYLFKFFHNIKSESKFIGINNLSQLAHDTVKILDGVRKGSVTLNEEIKDILRSVVDITKELFARISIDPQNGLDLSTNEISIRIQTICDINAKTGNNVAEDKPVKEFAPCIPVLDMEEYGELLYEFISESKDHLSNAENVLLGFNSSTKNSEDINKIFRAFHTIKGNAGFLNLFDINRLTHETETMMEYVRKGTLSLEKNIVDAVLEAIDSTRKLLDLLHEQVSNKGELKSGYYDVSETINSIHKILNESLPNQAQKTEHKKSGEILIETNSVNRTESGNAAEVREISKIPEIQPPAVAEETIKIAIDKLDSLINMVGELVITGAQVLENETITTSTDNRLVNDVRELTRIIRYIQDISINMRLVPIRALFQKMQRLVRDVSSKVDKDIEIKLYGEDTEIDKNIIDSLGDPLMHLLRNAVDHGIEAKEKRVSAGKNPKGLIELKAFHESGNIIIEIRDDGGGLNKEKIIESAIKKGLINNADGLNDNRIHNLIFEPGFSTADKVTDISGRGVGMDVVRKNIEKLRGKIEIESAKSKGTTFTIKLPLTLAIIDGITLRAGSERYIAPIFSVVEFIKPDSQNVSSVHGKGELITVHGDLYQIIRLSELFQQQSSKTNIGDMIGCILDSDYGRCCLVVDELIGQQQVVIKSLGENFKNVKGIAGGTILGDGKVGLILDINAIVAMSKKVSKTLVI